MSDDAHKITTPLEVLGVMASQNVMLTPTLRHIEMYTMKGLLSALWHEPTTDLFSAGVVTCGGAMGGLLGPGEGLYHELGQILSARGVPTLRVSYRRPNDMDACCVDVAAAVQLLVGSGVERVVIMGHSFGGAVAVRVAVALPDIVAGVVTFSTQSAGCEIAGGLNGRPLLLFHGDKDEILPVEASEVVKAIAGHGDLHIMSSDGHLLTHSQQAMLDILLPWLDEVLGLHSV